jgi:hypothetical protein
MIKHDNIDLFVLDPMLNFVNLAAANEKFRGWLGSPSGD